MPALAKKMTKAELDATYLASFAASCALSNDWAMLREEIQARITDAEKRGERNKLKALKKEVASDGIECPVCGICP